jgi:hypothetical protein
MTASQSRVQRIQDRICKWAAAVFAVVMAGYAAVAVADVVHLLSIPAQLDYEEGNILNAGLRIVHGLTPYPDPHGWPIVFNPYGPLAYLSTAALIKVFGVSFTAPRALIVLCAVAVAGLLIALLRHFGSSWPAALGFGCVLLCEPTIRIWMPILRVDFLGLVLSLAGVCVFFVAPRRWYIATAFLVAALFVKYSLLAAPASCGLYLILQRDWKRLWQALGMGSALAIVGFGATQIWSGGHFAFHMFRTHPDPFRLSAYFGCLSIVFWEIPVIWGLVALAIVFDVLHKKISFGLLYFVMALCGAITAGKLGSNVNHLIELMAASCLCAGMAWHELSEWAKAKGAEFLSVSVLLVVASAALALFSVQFRRVDAAGCEQADTFLRSHGDQVLSENVGALLLSGKPVLLSNPYVFAQLVMHRAWPDAQVRDRLRNRQFDVVVIDRVTTSNNNWSPGVLADIQQNYHLDKEFACPQAGRAYLPKVATAQEGH